MIRPTDSFLLLTVLFLTACHRHEGNEAIARAQEQRLEKMRLALIGKSCPALREVIGEPVADR